MPPPLALVEASRPTSTWYVPVADGRNVAIADSSGPPQERSRAPPTSRLSSDNAAPGANTASRTTEPPVTSVTSTVASLPATSSTSNTSWQSWRGAQAQSPVHSIVVTRPVSDVSVGPESVGPASVVPESEDPVGIARSPPSSPPQPIDMIHQPANTHRAIIVAPSAGVFGSAGPS